MDIFEQATRIPLRFSSPAGMLSVEDLWNLPLLHPTRANLNDIAKAVNKQVRETEEEDFVTVSGQTTAASNAVLALDVVKRVIEVKKAENAEKAAAVAKKEQKQAILALIEQKKTEALSNLTIEELQAQIEAL